ncbi:MAG: Crp/Fnr family transcriptional regulator [Chloroflexi bacterium]|nr:Crp/Fnr family transcriptional regulator [Chloroflexota bacterium]
MEIELRSYLKYLDTVEFFNGIQEGARLDILNHGQVEEILENEYIFFQGDSADRMYIVLSGRIRLTQTNEEGQQIVHHHPGVGEAFGIIAVLRSSEFPVTAQAVENTILLRWNRDTILQLMTDHPHLALNAINILSKFIIDFQQRIQQLSSEKAESRIAYSILRLADKASEVNDAGEKFISIKLTRQEISEMAGTTLFTVSRIMSKWEREGIVISRNQHLFVQKPELLQQIARNQ